VCVCVLDTRKAAIDDEAQLRGIITNLREDLNNSRRAASEAEQKVSELTRRLDQMQRHPIGPKVVYLDKPVSAQLPGSVDSISQLEDEDALIPQSALCQVKVKLQETERENIALRNALRRVEIDIQAVHNVLTRSEQAKKRLQSANDDLKVC